MDCFKGFIYDIFRYLIFLNIELQQFSHTVESAQLNVVICNGHNSSIFLKNLIIITDEGVWLLPSIL